jgi:hypothetical protein
LRIPRVGSENAPSYSRCSPRVKDSPENSSSAMLSAVTPDWTSPTGANAWRTESAAPSSSCSRSMSVCDMLRPLFSGEIEM